MLKYFIFILSVVVAHLQICRTIDLMTDDLSVIPQSSLTIDNSNEEINDDLLNDDILDNDPNIIKTKFTIRLEFKPHDLKYHNHSTFKIKYNFNEISQHLQFNQFEFQHDSKSTIDLSTTFNKSCFQLEEKRLQLNERQSSLIKWRKNLKEFASKLKIRKNHITQKEQKIIDDEKQLQTDILQIHNKKIEFERMRFQLEKEREIINKEKLHLQNKEEQLKIYQQEIKKKMNNLTDLYTPINNETQVEFNTNHLKLNSSINQYNTSYCDMTKIFENYRSMKLCQWNKSLELKIRELEQAKDELKGYMMIMINKTHHQLDRVKLKFQEVQHNLQESAKIIGQLLNDA